MASISSTVNNTSQPTYVDQTSRQSRELVSTSKDKPAMTLIENDELLKGHYQKQFESLKFSSSRNDGKSISPSIGTVTASQSSRRGRVERIGDVQIMAVEQACDVIHAYSHVISQYINYSNNLSDQDADEFEIALQAHEAKKLKFSVISLTLHILSRKFEK